MPNTPQQLEGTRGEPPPSAPTASGPRPAATEDAAPPLEPPQLLSRFQGLRVTPKTRLSVKGLNPNSEVLVFPSTIAPAFFKRDTTTASSSGTKSSNNLLPKVVRTPLVKIRSFTETGTP